MDQPELYTHFRVDCGEYPDGIYRVVGVSAESVTLLRVGDPDGRRANTGELIRVGIDDIAGLEAARNPDGNRPLAENVSQALAAVYWSSRTFVGSVIRNPVPASISGIVLLVGIFGERIASGPELVFDLLVLVGAVGLAVVGSGRLPRE
jgi:hypothetical protein